ncbi:MAG: sugar phosphate isomerase/epimerase [Oscillospiraceae bacterium]|nr:sugar phosphate isomerase/epimerase [Oscillospiraceae bacterium]
MKLSFEIWPNAAWGRCEIVGPAWNSWGDKPLDWCIRQVKKYGYDGFDVIFSKLEEIRPENREAQVKAIRAAMQETGLAFSSIGVHTTMMSYRWFDVEKGIQRLKNAVDWAVETDCDCVVTLVGDGYYDPPQYNVMSRKEAWRQTIASTKEVAQYAKDRGINFSIELLQGSLINTVEDMLKLFEIVDMPNLYCCIDVGTWYSSVKPKIAIPEAVSKLKDRIKVIHVKDEVGFPNLMSMQHVWFGAGLVNFREMADALKAVGYNDYCAVEWEGWQAGGLFGLGEPSAVGLADFDRVAEEAIEYLREQGW